MMSDWRSYDEIAERYDRVWSARFEAVARHIWALMSPRASDKLLDIGTGTGIVPDKDFTLEPADVVNISIAGIGTLANPVVRGR